MADEIVFLLDSKIYFKGSINNLKNKTKHENLEVAILKILMKESV